MMRLPAAGSFSMRKPSPAWKRVGGVDRSTSSTNPGRGISGSCSSVAFLLVAQVEGHLDRAAGAGGGGVFDGLGEAGERVGGADQPTEVSSFHQLEGQVE